MENEIMGQIRELVKKYYGIDGFGENVGFEGRKSKIPLNVPTYDVDEIMEAVDCLLSTRVTMGQKTYQFERLFASFIGTKYSTMVNSGSSANLVALSILSNRATRGRIKPGDEIITPAVTWSTTVSPIHNIGAVPVLVDIDMESYTIDIDQIRKNITPKTKAIMPVHLLGNPADMKQIMEIAQQHGLFVVEDTCESHGAVLDGKKAGSFGDISTFSFFFSHHISTIEGGMLLTNNHEYSELSKALRAHGWTREMADRKPYLDKNPGIDPRFLFVNYGYNLRPTDLQGGFGIRQMEKIERLLEARRLNANYWCENLEKYSDSLMITRQRPGTLHSWYGFPITVRESAKFRREQLTAFLEKKGIETRPLMSGNIADQPMMGMMDYRKGSLENAQRIMKNSFFFGNHHWVKEKERQYVVECFDEFFKSIGKA
ncbi:aminotransferase class V-fold PLP-dependent enzyme [Candidatus Parvarchaeota archaeon]|nr:aminotransferase class V-fold PLP-dependent enzyme [Candidatus Parvarchaeota archaeon]